MTNELNKKNPHLSGNSDEGAGILTNPVTYDDTLSLAYSSGNFNREKFDIGLLSKVKGRDGQYTALCPAHDDRASSLSVKIAGDRVLLHCHAGCSVDSIMDKLGLPLSALFLSDEQKIRPRHRPKSKPKQSNTVTYDYLNPDGSLAYRKIRYEYDNGTKTFAFFTPDGKKGVSGVRRVPYNLPAVLAAETIYFVEGEKAADAVIKAGRVATSLDAGANSRWLPEYTAFFEGKNIVIIPDNDTPGMNYARSVARNLPGANIVKLPDIPEKGDIYDWLNMGRGMEDVDLLPFEDPETDQDDTFNIEAYFLPDDPGFIAINPFETQMSKYRYRWNDIGISNLFADCYKNVSRYVPEASSWYTYNGCVWKQDIAGVAISNQAKKFMYHMLITCQKFIDDDDTRSKWVDFVTKRMKKQARDAMISDAASVWPLSILEFDRDPFIFNCLNCTLDLRTVTAYEHSPGDFLSKVSSVRYDEQADCERWKLFINEIMQGDTETAEFLQKAMGYTLTGDTSEECFFILYGSTTRNGKGTTMETMLYLMGDYGRTIQPETVAQRQTTHSGGPTEDIARLKGARFVNMSEPDKGLRLNSALVKQVTGGDTVTARFLHQNSFEYRPDYKLFINTNHLPKVSDDSIFSSGRVKLIPFERHFEPNEQDKGLKSFFRQPENISGVFNWLLEGLRMMKTEGLVQPEAVRAATEQYREESDIIGQFVKENLVRCENNRLKTRDAYAAYEKFCYEYGFRSLNNQNFVGELRKKGYVREKRDRTLGNIIENYMLADEIPDGFF